LEDYILHFIDEENDFEDEFKFTKNNTFKQLIYEEVMAKIDGEKIIKYTNEKKIMVDVLKVSHHGSYWNNCEIMKNIIADNYIISTNGKKYGHPDKNILANIIINNKQNKKLIFNYEIDDINILKNQEQKDKYNYEYIIGDELII